MRCDIYSLLRHRLVILAVVAVTGTVGISSADQPESDPYPLRICVILDCELDDGAEVLYAGDREIRVCCQQCVNEFSDAWIDVIDEQIIEQQTPFYPVKTCVVDGKRLDDFNATKKVVGNRLFCLCSNDCCKAVEQQSGKYFGLLNKAVIKQQKPNYPLARCVVSGEPLGKDAIDHVVGNQLIRLASEEQLDKFDANPGKYLHELRQLSRKKAE